jgi:hypothetical protein
VTKYVCKLSCMKALGAVELYECASANKAIKKTRMAPRLLVETCLEVKIMEE